MWNFLKFASNFNLSDEEKAFFQQIIGIETALRIMTEEAGKQIEMRRAKIASRVVHQLILTLRSFSDGAKLDYLISPIIHSVVREKLLYTSDDDLSFRNQNSFCLPITDLNRLGYETQDQFVARLNEIWSEFAKITYNTTVGNEWRFYIELIY